MVSSEGRPRDQPGGIAWGVSLGGQPKGGSAGGVSLVGSVREGISPRGDQPGDRSRLGISFPLSALLLI